MPPSKLAAGSLCGSKDGSRQVEWRQTPSASRTSRVVAAPHGKPSYGIACHFVRRALPPDDGERLPCPVQPAAHTLSTIWHRELEQERQQSMRAEESKLVKLQVVRALLLPQKALEGSISLGPDLKLPRVDMSCRWSRGWPLPPNQGHRLCRAEPAAAITSPGSLAWWPVRPVD